MPIFDAHRELPVPEIPPFAELPEDRKEIAKVLWPRYMNEDLIRAVAHRQWERDGCPDGEHMQRFLNMKLRDVHWWQAKMMIETVFDMDMNTICLMRSLWKERGCPS